MATNQTLSPEKYICTKGRNLSIDHCLINEGWEKITLANVFVFRKHNNGNYTVGVYLVDTACLGVKNTLFQFNQTEEEIQTFMKRCDLTLAPISYNEAHNLVYGAIAYAEELGFKPHKEFSVTRFLLEEDTDDIPLIEYEYGHEGKPLLVVHSEFEGKKYLSILNKSIGVGNYHYMIGSEKDSY